MDKIKQIDRRVEGANLYDHLSDYVSEQARLFHENLGNLRVHYEDETACLQKELDSLRKERDRLVYEKEDALRQVALLENQDIGSKLCGKYNDLKDKVHLLEVGLADKSKSNKVLWSEADRLRTELADMKERAVTACREATQAAGAKWSAMKELDKLKLSIKEREERCERACNQATQSKKERDACYDEMCRLRSKLEEAKDRTAFFEGQAAARQNTIATLRGNLRVARVELCTVRKKLETCISARRRLNSKLIDRRKTITSLEEDLGAAKDAQSKLTTSLEIVRSDRNYSVRQRDKAVEELLAHRRKMGQWFEPCGTIGDDTIYKVVES